MNRAAIVALAGGLLALGAACSGDDDDTGVLESQDTSQGESSDAGTGEADDMTDETGDAPTAGTTAVPGSGEPLGTARASLAGGGGNTPVPVRMDVMRLRRTGDLVVLELVLSNESDESDDPGNDQMYVSPLFEFGGGSSRTDLAGIGLVDQAEQRMYLPVLDSADLCLCSDMTLFPRLDPGASIELSATFGGVPEDVDQLDVHIPAFPPITGMPVEQ